MAAPLATEKVIRGALQALQRAGVISSSSDVAKLESIPNNASDADISTILDTIVFGGVPTASSVVRSDEDVDIFIDADDDDTPLITPRYFRISENQSDPPVTDDDHEMLTVTKTAWGIGAYASTLTVGPRTALAAAAKAAVIHIGTDPFVHYGRLIGSNDAVADGTEGLSIRSNKKLDIRCDKNIYTASVAGAIVGGWEGPATVARLHVGDFTLGNPESLAIEAEDIAGRIELSIRPTYDGASTRRLFIGGSSAVVDYWSHIIIGGKAGEAWAEPTTHGNASLLVVGGSHSPSATIMYVYDRRATRDAASEIVTIKSDATPSGKYYYIRIIDPGNLGVFNVDSDGNANLAGGKAYQSGGADIAELVVADYSYAPGTVLALQQGLYTETTMVAQPNVVGVVATQPGVLLGACSDYDRSGEFKLTLLHTEGAQSWLTVSGYVADRIGTHVCIGGDRFVEVEEAVDEVGRARVYLAEKVQLSDGMQVYGGITRQPNAVRLVMCGIVPVWCSTAGGDILGNGEALVSGPSGCAVVDHDPKPGTIIGKAQGRLVENGSGIVKEKIEVLVNLQ